MASSSVVVENDSGEPSRENSSDEDTEDASEPEMVKMETEDNGCSGSFEEKLASLKAQVKQLKDGTDPEYLKKVREIEAVRDKRLFVAEAFRQYELECAEDEYERERALALRELEEKKAELKECLLHELLEKKKAYETYRHSMELGSGVDTFEPKMMVTRKLRRRHYDPMPIPERKRKPIPTSSLVYVLDENEVDEDLKVIFKGKVSTTAKNLTSPGQSNKKPPEPVAYSCIYPSCVAKTPPTQALEEEVPVSNNDSGIIYEARIEDGKLQYENRWFHKGQHIFIESKEHGQESGIITSISQSEIWVKRLPDNSKLRIYLSQLTRGKYVLKRRSA